MELFPCRLILVNLGIAKGCNQCLSYLAFIIACINRCQKLHTRKICYLSDARTTASNTFCDGKWVNATMGKSSIYYGSTTGNKTVLKLRSNKQYVPIFFHALIISLKLFEQKIFLDNATGPLCVSLGSAWGSESFPPASPLDKIVVFLPPELSGLKVGRKFRAKESVAQAKGWRKGE